MGFGEIIPHLQRGVWVRRYIWHKDYAIRLMENNYLMSSINLIYHLGDTYAPHKGDDLNQNNINRGEFNKGNSEYVWRKCGLKYDVFCDDWEIADQKHMEEVVVRTEKEEEYRKAREEEMIHRGNTSSNSEDETNCDNCNIKNCDDCPIEIPGNHDVWQMLSEHIQSKKGESTLCQKPK